MPHRAELITATLAGPPLDQPAIRLAKLTAAKTKAEETARELQKAQYELEVASAQQRKAEDLVLQYQGKQDHYDILTETLRLSLGSNTPWT